MDPVARPKASGARLADRPIDIGGATIGYLDNGWWSFGLIVDRVQKTLVERYGVAGSIHLKKSPGGPAAKQVEELADKCKVVVNGLGN